ncbi:MAG: glycosyltransferase family 39 protein [Cyclobacteriaceae bacterium]
MHFKKIDLKIGALNRIQNRPILFLTLLFVLVNGFFFWKLGVSVDDDTERFMAYADEIREFGLFFKPHDFWYLGYVLFILAITSVYDTLAAIVLVQVLLSFLAMISLYYSGQRLFGNQTIGLLASVAFLGFYLLPFWNYWIYAESLFISLNCFALCYLIQWYTGKISWRNMLAGTLIICWAILTKPTGIALLAAVLVPLVYLLIKNMNKWSFKVGTVMVFVVGFLLLLNEMLSTFGFVEAYQNGEIIYGAEKVNHQAYAKGLLMVVPESLYLPDKDHPSLVQLVLLFFGNPVYSLKLFSTKLFYYILAIRPYYSFLHNTYLLGFLLPLYYLFVVGLKKSPLDTTAYLFIGCFILIHTLSGTLLTINWNSRFLLPVLPLVFLVGGNEKEKIVLKKIRLRFSAI